MHFWLYSFYLEAQLYSIYLEFFLFAIPIIWKEGE